MSESTDQGVRIPPALWKILSAVLTAVILGSGTWCVTLNNRVNALELTLDATRSMAVENKAKMVSVESNNTQIAVLNAELGNIKEGIADIKELLKER
jgi:hypothetical protein